jgi:hypothetical protein
MPMQPPPALKAGPFGTRGGMSLGPKPTDMKLPPPKAPSGLRIEHRVGVQAPAEVIWEAISDIEAWSQWNKLYPKASGQIRIGSVLDVTLALPGQAEQQIRPTVMEWVPNEQLHWKLSTMGGLVKTIRYFEIEALAEASCIVTNGEILGGLIGPRVGKRMARTIYRAFAEMNDALKARAEALWQARQP